MPTIGEEIKQKVDEIQNERDPLMKKVLAFQARASLYIYTRVCEAIERGGDQER